MSQVLPSSSFGAAFCCFAPGLHLDQGPIPQLEPRIVEQGKLTKTEEIRAGRQNLSLFGILAFLDVSGILIIVDIYQCIRMNFNEL